MSSIEPAKLSDVEVGQVKSLLEPHIKVKARSYANRIRMTAMDDIQCVVHATRKLSDARYSIGNDAALHFVVSDLSETMVFSMLGLYLRSLARRGQPVEESELYASEDRRELVDLCLAAIDKTSRHVGWVSKRSFENVAVQAIAALARCLTGMCGNIGVPYVDQEACVAEAIGCAALLAFRYKLMLVSRGESDGG